MTEKPASEPNAATAPGALDRLLRVFTDVEAGEAGTALLMFLNLFLLLLGYYVLRNVRECVFRSIVITDSGDGDHGLAGWCD